MKVQHTVVPWVAALLAPPVLAQSPGSDFVNSITQIEAAASQSVATNPPEEVGLGIWDAAKDATRALCACNDLQRQYQNLSLEYQTWQDEFQVCYYSIYIHLGEPGGPSVGQFLDCIQPVNIGLIGTRSARSGIQLAVQQAPCDTGFSCAVPGTDAIISAEVFQKTRQLVRDLSKLSPRKFIKNLKEGYDFFIDPTVDGRAEVALDVIKKFKQAGQTVKVAVKIGGGSGQSTVETPATVRIQAEPRIAKHIKDERTTKLRVTTTFTRGSDGVAFSSQAQKPIGRRTK